MKKNGVNSFLPVIVIIRNIVFSVFLRSFIQSFEKSIFLVENPIGLSSSVFKQLFNLEILFSQLQDKFYSLLAQIIHQYLQSFLKNFIPSSYIVFWIIAFCPFWDSVLCDSIE